MRFIVDMNLSPEWCVLLIESGHEARHWSEVGHRAALDTEILANAADSQAVVFTHDLDYGAILAFSGASTPSVLQVRDQDVDPATLGPAVLAAIEAAKDALERGAIVTVDRIRSKVTVLPLHRKERPSGGTI